ncbi:hypothetical protein TRVA0_034S01618 [Trichomonascus vanleenenianus]|uniref:cytochrome P450 n=1 Tax=Trichomonascus vanleenenianus TaxID=2268995 RepID=UPI003ECB1F47
MDAVICLIVIIGASYGLRIIYQWLDERSKWCENPKSANLIQLIMRPPKFSDWRAFGLFFKELGPTFRYRSLFYNWILTTDPENIRAVLSTQQAIFNLGRRPYQLELLIGEDGIFAAEGQKWQHSRMLLKPQFIRENLSHLSMLENHIPTLIKIVRRYNGQPFDFSEVICRYTLTVGLDFLTGTNIGSLESFIKHPDWSIYGASNTDWKENIPIDSDEGKHRFVQAFELVQRDMNSRVVYPQLIYCFLKTKNVEKASTVIHSFIDHFIERALNANQDTIEQLRASHRHVLLYHLIEQNKDPRFLRDQLLSLLQASRETTSSLLIWTFFYLSRHRRVYERLKKEIRTQFGPGSQEDVQNITFDSIRKNQYLRAVVNETLRLAPGVPLNYRHAAQDTVLPTGGGESGKSPMMIRKGQPVFFSTYFLHRRNDIWGDDAEEYRPERWETMKLPSWSFLPFGAGPRVCMGQQYAYTEAFYCIVRLLQTFDHLECGDSNLSDSHDFIKLKRMNILQIQGGCKIRFS